MPPNGNAGASIRSNFSNGYGRPKYCSIQPIARCVSARSVSASASLARDFRTNRLIERPFTTDVVRCQGPAANAMRYVESGRVSVKCLVMRSALLSARVMDPFANAVQAGGVVSVSVTRAFRSGWSKHGKSWSASAGTSSV